jgi:hypothetical protein
MILIAVWLVGRALPSFRRLFIGTMAKLPPKRTIAGLTDGRDHASDELVDTLLPSFCSDPTVEVLRGYDIERGLRPVCRNTNVLLQEDDVSTVFAAP